MKVTPMGALMHQAQTRPKSAAFVFQEEVWTYERLAAESERLARGLAAPGVGPGDRVALHIMTSFIRFTARKCRQDVPVLSRRAPPIEVRLEGSPRQASRWTGRGQRARNSSGEARALATPGDQHSLLRDQCCVRTAPGRLHSRARPPQSYGDQAKCRMLIDARMDEEVVRLDLRPRESTPLRPEVEETTRVAGKCSRRRRARNTFSG
jgi:hypothetical protein